MTIKSIQKVIKVGSSAGTTIPAKDMKRIGIHIGDEVEVIIRKNIATNQSDNSEVIIMARDILTRYRKDFENLSKR